MDKNQEDHGGGNPSSGAEEQLPVGRPASMAGEGRHERESSNSGPYVPPPLATSSTRLGVPSYGGASRSAELIIKVLCPSDKIELVIGEVDRIREEIGTQIEVADEPIGPRSARVITVISTESMGVKSKAVEAVLMLQQKIYDRADDILQLLVPPELIRFIIGRGGFTIWKIREKTKADVLISEKDQAPTWADGNELVEISGPVENVREALIKIVLKLRDKVLSSGGSSSSSSGQRGL